MSVLAVKMKKQVIWVLYFTLSVLFHFDCVTSKPKEIVEVSLTIRSSPVPGEKSLTPVTSSLKLSGDLVLFERQNRYKRNSLFSGITGIVPPAPDIPTSRPPVVMTINFTIVGSTVKIKFGPVEQNMTYRVCLSQVRKEYECYKDAVSPQGENLVVFKNVEPDRYIIYVQKRGNPDNPMYASKPFNVTEIQSLPTEPTIAGSVVAIITMACLLFVAGVTTLCFCLMRERCHCIPTCSCGLYSRTPNSDVPNNIPGEEEDDSALEVLPLFYDESEHFTLAVQKVCHYINKWANCKINLDWTHQFSNLSALSFKEKKPNCILLIFLSSKMWTLLSNCQQVGDQKTLLYKRILMEHNGNTFHKMVVSLHPLAVVGKYLERLQIFRITKHTTGNNQNRLEMNTEDLYTMLKQINGDTGTVQPGWSSYEELLSLFNAIKYVPENDLDLGKFQSKIVQNINKETVNLTSEKQEKMKPAICTDKNCQKMCSIRQKQVETYKWASSQPTGCYSPYSQSGYIPASVYYPVDELGHDQLRTHEEDVEIESASICQDPVDQRETIQSACQRCYPEFHLVNKHLENASHLGDWLPPEDDSESVSQSVIGQKQIEFYQKYKATMDDTRV